jgi:hypothetical protein
MYMTLPLVLGDTARYISLKTLLNGYVELRSIIIL